MVEIDVMVEQYIIKVTLAMPQAHFSGSYGKNRQISRSQTTYPTGHRLKQQTPSSSYVALQVEYMHFNTQHGKIAPKIVERAQIA